MIDFLKKQLFTVHQNGKHQVSEVFKFIGPGINLYSSIAIDCICYWFIPSIVDLSNVLEFATTYYNFFAALYDE